MGIHGNPYDTVALLAKLPPRGVCSRIPHTMSRQCCITYHRKAHIIPFLVTPRLRGLKKICRRITGFPLQQFGDEVHLKGIRQFRRGTEREVHVLPQHLRDVRPRDIHPLGELGLVNAQLLHPPEYATKEGRADMVDGCHCGVTGNGLVAEFGHGDYRVRHDCHSKLPQ